MHAYAPVTSVWLRQSGHATRLPDGFTAAAACAPKPCEKPGMGAGRDKCAGAGFEPSVLSNPARQALQKLCVQASMRLGRLRRHMRHLSLGITALASLGRCSHANEARLYRHERGCTCMGTRTFR